MDIALLIGRIIFGLYWLNTARNHFVNHVNLEGYAKYKGVPAARVAILGSGVLALLGGLSVLLGAWPNVGLALLIVFLVPVSFKMHAYWKETDATAKMSEHVNFFKNMALVGSLLMMYALSQPWSYSLFN